MPRVRSKLAAESPGQLEPGSVVDGFRIERVLSVGPANHTLVQATAPNGARVALKLVADAVSDPESKRRIIRMARKRISIDHPHLVRLIKAGEHGGRLYLVSELPGARTLADRLDEGPLEPEEALRLAAGVAGALQTAAREGLIHAELSPESIMVAEDQPAHALLTDFGIGRLRARPDKLHMDVEAPDYRSPEEIRGEPVEAKSNAYSLACVLFECLTGTPPYPYERPLLTLHAHLVEPPPRPSTHRPDLPPELDDVFARALAKEPDRRTDTVAVVRAAADALGVEVEIPSGRRRAKKQPPRRPQRPITPSRPKRRAAAAAKTPPPARAARRRGRSFGSRAAIALALLALVASAVGGFALGSFDPARERADSSAAQPRAAAAQLAEAEYVRSVNPVIDRLSARRTAARLALRRAGHPERQADAAKALVAAYAQARRALPANSPESLDAAELRDRLQSAERAYRSLVAAARNDNRQAWRSASKAAVENERRLDRSLRTLTSA
jgi:hypothetical protein